MIYNTKNRLNYKIRERETLNEFALSRSDLESKISWFSYEINYHLSCIIIRPYDENVHHWACEIFNFCSNISGIRFKHNNKFPTKEQIDDWLFGTNVYYDGNEVSGLKGILDAIYLVKFRSPGRCYPYYSKEIENAYLDMRDAICDLIVEKRGELSSEDILDLVDNCLPYLKEIAIKF